MGATRGRVHGGARLAGALVNGLADVSAIAGGSSFTLAVKADGTVWGWGENTYGQLGDGTIISRHEPVAGVAVGERLRRVGWRIATASP